MKKSIIAFVFFLTGFVALLAQQNRYKQVEKNTMEGTKYGILDTKTNQEIIPAIYDKIGDYSEGKFTVKKAGKVGNVDTTNKIIIPIQYPNVTGYIDGRVFVSNGKKWAMADNKGKILTQFLYDEILGYQDSVARVAINDKIGYINSNGGTILPCKFDEGYDCNGDFILIYSTHWHSMGYDVVKTDFLGKEVSRQNVGIHVKTPALFNRKGVMIYKGDASEKIDYAPGSQIAIIDNYSKYYYAKKVIDKTGKVIIPYEKEYELKVYDVCIEIKKGEGAASKYGIMNFKGEILLQPNFADITGFKFNNGELAKVTFQNGGYFYVDKNYKCVEFESQKCPE